MVIGDNIVVIGGYGHVGKVICDILGHRFPGRVFAAGRDFEKAEALSSESDRRVLPLQIDLTDARSVEKTLDNARLVVVCVDQEDTSFARTCLDRGVHYVDITASYGFLSRVERLDTLARERGATGVLSVGLAPGLTNLLARHCKDVLGNVRDLDIYVMLGLGEAHGEAAVRWTLVNLDRRFEIRRAGVPRMVDSFEDPKRTVFPGKYGRRTAYLFDFADQHVVARTLDVENVATRLCFDSALMTRLVALLKRTGLLGVLTRPELLNVLVPLAMRFHPSRDEFVVKVDAEATIGSNVRACSGSISGRGEGYATGVVAALVAERVYTAGLARGVFHIDQLFSPPSFFDRIKDYGLAIYLQPPQTMAT